ncbi:hypothetical protein E5K00_04380 [Hymenobacter aquaticus]|uniref:STAS/SEC14 domain-containing protein n=1 Tax=Hymenobacter aquaticus TaxID=1867101 RepID=A0A4Z0Q4P5_9BACT|nr:hypothetical protein [Hymenobacter aquaticus]TGE24459.1 hypothetical protein E5K00_04380 [Hymenobacter aquaticus]
MAHLLYPNNASLYYHNELASVVEHADGYVRIDWNPVPIRSSSLRAVYEQVLTLLRQQGFAKVLSDHQLLPPIQPSDQEWLSQDWVPRAVAQAGYRCCALVQAHDVLSQISLTHIVRQLGPVPLIVRYFEDSSAAERWIRSC